MERLLLAALAVVALAGCSQPEHAVKTLEAQGYTDVRTDGFAWFACSEDDTWQTKFYAKSSNGTPISGAVCTGLFLKGSTIRLD